MKQLVLACVFAPMLLIAPPRADAAAGSAALGTHPYDRFEKAETCGSCHTDFYQQWRQAMMSQCYTHHWDEIEYFRLAVPHAEKDEKVAEVKEGCNGCHAPFSFLAGDVPPPRPEENSRANESVSCDLCHTIAGCEGERPYNFIWVSTPGTKKYGPKPGLESPYHETEESEFLRSAEFCGTCHNEMSPFGAWVKATQIEWEEGPYSKEGVPCHQCHMPGAWGKNATMADEAWVAQHLFHGAHDPGKLAGAVEIRMHPEEREVEVRDPVVLKIQLFNAKAGHKIPTGSVEDRIVWLHVIAADSEGKTYHLAVDPKGFEGEEYTIASDALAYQDMGIALDIPGFAGLPRDGVPGGDRIFRMPYFDPEGRMTIQQWNTKSFGADYRLGPRETKIETFTWELPDDIAVGKVTFSAELNYRKLIGPVAEFLEVPAEESETVLINRASTWVEIYD
ncbi:MAG: multiheme c-type cytochrome [Candidatus Eisenbacteria bacterium]